MTDHIDERAEEYFTGALSAHERASIEAHLTTCGDCRNAFTSVRLALDALASIPPRAAIAERLPNDVIAIARRPATWMLTRAASIVALAALCGLSGFLIGRRSVRSTVAAVPADTTLHQFLMLLEEPAWPPRAPLSRTGYREWVVSLADRFVGAEKLTEEAGYRVEQTGDAEPAVGPSRSTNFSGWYVVRAHSYTDAIRLARLGPHLSYGTILVRQVE